MDTGPALDCLLHLSMKGNNQYRDTIDALDGLFHHFGTSGIGFELTDAVGVGAYIHDVQLGLGFGFGFGFGIGLGSGLVSSTYDDGFCKDLDGFLREQVFHLSIKGNNQSIEIESPPKW